MPGLKRYCNRATLFLICLLLQGCSNISQKHPPHAIHRDSALISITNTSYTPAYNTGVKLVNRTNGTLGFYLTPANVDYLDDSTLTASLLNNRMNDSEKARQLYQFVYSQQTFSKPISTQSKLVHQPARFFQSFGAGQCDDANSVLCALALKAGLKARLYHLTGHIVAEIYYDNGWHMFDANNGITIKDAQNKILSVREIENDPDIIDKSHTGRGVMHAIAMRLLKKTIASAKDNYTDNWLLVTNSDYNATVKLLPQDSIVFSVRDNLPASLLNFRLQNSLYTKGTHSSKFSFSSKGEYIHSVALPYAIKQAEVKGCSQPCYVYFSVDSVKWHFKGIATPASTLIMATKQSAEVPFVFNYHLKIVPIQSNAGGIAVGLVNHFTFSEKQFIANYNKVLHIKPVGESRLNNLSVELLP